MVDPERCVRETLCTLGWIESNISNSEARRIIFSMEHPFGGKMQYTECEYSLLLYIEASLKLWIRRKRWTNGSN